MRTWIERAIIAKRHQLEIRLAWSVEMPAFDWLDIELISKERSN